MSRPLELTLYADRGFQGKILLIVHHSLIETSNSKKYPRPATAFRVKYDITKYSYSSIKIDQLRMSGETYKPFKGFRANSKGDVDWRW